MMVVENVVVIVSEGRGEKKSTHTGLLGTQDEEGRERRRNARCLNCTGVRRPP